MDLDEWMRPRHGVAHSSELRAAGFGAHVVTAAVESGRLRRVRRSWLIAPSCDGRRVAAAAISGRVTCVTGAALLGLWTPPHDDLHMAVASNASRVAQPGIRLHWAQGPAPVSRTRVDDPVLNILFHVAACADRADALSVWESAIRLRHVDAEILPRVAWRSSRARELASLASGLSDSGVESRFLELMRGRGISVRQQVWIDGHPVDGLVGDRLVIQLDGFAHHREAKDRRRDLAADARLVLRGYTVLRFDYQQVMFDAAHVVGTMEAAIAQGLHRIR